MGIKKSLLLLAFLLFLIVFFFEWKNKQKQLSLPVNDADSISHLSSNQTEQSKIYQSKALKLKIVLPSDYQIEERFTTITLKRKDEKGEIVVDRSGSHFKNLDDHLNYLTKMNQIRITDRKKLIINGLSTVRGKIIYSNRQEFLRINYFIYTNNWIYTLFATSPSLFNDLDQIARSFEYTP